MQKNISINKKLLLGLAALPVGLILFWLLYFSLNLRAVESEDVAAVTFEVKPGESSLQISRNLEEAELIRSSTAFNTYAGIHGLRTKFKAGTYALKPSQKASEIARVLAEGKADDNKLVIPEGTTIKKVIALAVKAGIPEADMNAALNSPYDTPLVRAKPANVSLEGYLFPDTYSVTPNTSARELVLTMIQNMEKKFTPELRQKFAARGYNTHEALTLSSMVEREVAKPSDRRIVAQVFDSRLKIGMTLGSDPTYEYAAEIMNVKPKHTLESPYNTYLVAGLPPGPIANPGVDAIEAAANPANTDFLYFVSAPDGTTYFTKTFKDHQRNIDKYLR